MRDALYGDLIWSRPGAFSRELILEAGSERLATLRWEKLFSFEATAESADGRWVIGRRRTGSLRGLCVVRDASTHAEVATFTRSWRGRGVVRFPSGAEYSWGREGFWRPRYLWMTPEQPRLIVFKSLFGFSRRFEMSADPGAKSREELPVLVLLGAYLMAMISAQSAAS